jgi:ABC-type sugar transport system ATPase subunit
MVGRPIKEGQRQSFAKKENVVLEVKDLSHVTPAGKKQLDNISFKVGEGEVMGIAGLMGSGRSELLRSLLGLLPGDRQGQVIYQGKPANFSGMEEALAAGVGFVPEDRKKDGLFLDLGVDFNLTISSLLELQKNGALDLERESEWVAEHAKAMNVKASSYKNPIRTLSGGNQQKVLLAKMVSRNPKVLFLDEPTRGIDVGAKEEIYEIIRRLASTGISIVVVSSELPEVLALSDRVLVLKEGRAVGELENRGLTQESIMAFAAGGNHVH